MPYQEFQDNLQKFTELLEQIKKTHHEQNDLIIKRYVEQNLLILNHMIGISIESLRHIQGAKSTTEILHAQTQFINEINKKITMLNHDFLNASLRTMSDYNEWLKAHCDLATD
jgi:hypothetical protein